MYQKNRLISLIHTLKQVNIQNIESINQCVRLIYNESMAVNNYVNYLKNTQPKDGVNEKQFREIYSTLANILDALNYIHTLLEDVQFGAIDSQEFFQSLNDQIRILASSLDATITPPAAGIHYTTPEKEDTKTRPTRGRSIRLFNAEKDDSTNDDQEIPYNPYNR